MTAIWAENLLKLQELDLEIRNLKLRLIMIPKETAAVKDRIAAIEAEVKNARDARQTHERELKQNEAEAQGLADKIAKLEQQSALVKKNSEYQAMLASIAMLKDSISTLETRALELMDMIDADGAAIREAEQSAKTASAGLRDELEELQSLSADVQKRIGELDSGRGGLRNMVDSELLSRYEMILKKNAGIPLVRVEADKCGHCHLRLTPQTLNYARSGAISYCDNCMHIIYCD
ncbi:hypothetical protein SDC9_60044 [bioreactor metagenome]|uniref:CT398-like coiled coil hairpin domain-containing protein n=1 Tax=bioreactor metagenome TaxID=1076179 RepID=A0A644XBX0_9ZZZZ